MTVSRTEILQIAADSGFGSVMLEKVIRLIGLLNLLNTHPYLKGRLLLKGGTALNLFFVNMPRLSVDIDLNYVGGLDRDAMVKERPKVEQAFQAVWRVQYPESHHPAVGKHSRIRHYGCRDRHLDPLARRREGPLGSHGQ